MISIVLFSDLQILLLAQICIWIPLVKFSFNILYFLVLEFPHGFILSLLLTFLFCSCEELTHWKRPWCWERLKAEGEGDDRGWDAWMASLTQWPWVWAISGSWWWTGKPGVLQFPWSQSLIGLSDWTELANCSPNGWGYAVCVNYTAIF